MYEDNKSTIFLYALIIIIALFISRFFKITISTIFFLIIAIIVICYINNKKSEASYNKKNEIVHRLNSIIPKPHNINNYPDFINFIYKIRNYHRYNSNAFVGIVQNIDKFILIYEKIMHNPTIYCGLDLLTAIDFARTAINNLQSMIYSIPTNKQSTNQLHIDLKKFDILLNNYVYILKTECNNNTTGAIPNFGPKPFNYYDNSKFNQFDFY